MNIKATIISKADLKRMLQRLALEILERNRGTEDLVLIGIKTRGEYLAQRIAKYIKAAEDVEVPVGALDITLYRDDLTEVSNQPMVSMHATDIPFDIAAKQVVLVDDVLYTGRTIRAALDSLVDIGRPAIIRLAALIDRGHRQLPIHADFVGKHVTTAKNERIEVRLQEVDKEDNVVIVG